MEFSYIINKCSNYYAPIPCYYILINFETNVIIILELLIMLVIVGDVVNFFDFF